MRRIWLAAGILALAVNPIAAFAQAGVTPLLTGPEALGPRRTEISGYISVENETDYFAVYRRGMTAGADFGLRAGYSDALGGGPLFGGDFRYELRKADKDFPLAIGLVGGLQVTLADVGDNLAFPIGLSLGRKVGNRARPIMLYGIPLLRVQRLDTGAKNDTELKTSLELGGQLQMGRKLAFDFALTANSDDQESVSFAVGLRWR